MVEGEMQAHPNPRWRMRANAGKGETRKQAVRPACCARAIRAWLALHRCERLEREVLNLANSALADEVPAGRARSPAAWPLGS